ncbi:MAG: hypothetical protein H6672_19250 [Anaerolineaceae bacterium]|nr:hypothetical protein [Anaerolineaceae bacterium]
MNIVDSATMNDWDRYIVFDEGISSWIQRRAKLHQLIQKWKDILIDMDIDEIKTFDEWGERVTQDKIYGMHRHFSVQELLKDLRDDGLL